MTTSGLLTLPSDLLATKIFARALSSLTCLYATSAFIRRIIKEHDSLLWRAYVWDGFSSPMAVPNGNWHQYAMELNSLKNMRWDTLEAPNSKQCWPSPRCGHTLTAIGPDRLLLFGGSHPSGAPGGIVFCGVRDPFYELDCARGTWKPVDFHFPDAFRAFVPYTGHSAVLHEGMLIIYGGMTKRGCLSGLVYIINISSMRCEQTQCFGRVSVYHSAVMSGGDMIVYGGIRDAGNRVGEYTDMELHELRVFNVKTLSWSVPDVYGPRPGPLMLHGGALSGGSMLLFGGLDASDNRHNSLFRYNPGTLCTWSPIKLSGDLVPPRSSCSFVGCGRFAFVVLGRGRDKRHIYDGVWCMDPVSGRSRQLFPEGGMIPRSTSCGCLVGGKVFFFGGMKYEDEECKYFSDLNVLHLTSATTRYPDLNRVQRWSPYGAFCPVGQLALNPVDLPALRRTDSLDDLV